jgi:hypothetical protein
VLGAGVVGAVIAGYPMVTHSSAEKATDATQSPQAFLAPVLAPGGAGAAFSMRF